MLSYQLPITNYTLREILGNLQMNNIMQEELIHPNE